MSARKLSAAGLVGLEELTEARTADVAIGSAPRALSRDTVASRDTPDSGGQLVVSLPLDSIKPNRHQPRRTFDAREIRQIADSIAAHGRVLQPILVRPAPDAEPGDAVRFELVAGEQRWRASELAGMSSIRAIVEGMDDATSATMALAENMARHDLNPIEKARGCAALRDRFRRSVTEIGRSVGRDRTAISHLIRLLDLPDNAQALIESGKLSEGHGRMLLRLPDFHAQAAFAERCAAEAWPVRKLERLVDELLAPSAEPEQRPVDQTAALEALTERLAPIFGPVPVRIVPRRRGTYEIQVQFEDLDALSAAVSRLAPDAPPRGEGVNLGP